MSWRLIKTFQDLGLSINPSGLRISDVLVGGYSTKASEPCEGDMVATVTLKAEDIIHSFLGTNATNNYPNLTKVIEKLCNDVEMTSKQEEGLVICPNENSIAKAVVLKNIDNLEKGVTVYLKGDGSVIAPHYGGAKILFCEIPHGDSDCYVHSNDIGNVANQMFKHYKIQLQYAVDNHLTLPQKVNSLFPDFVKCPFHVI